jgi:hypothetical protein
MRIGELLTLGPMVSLRVAAVSALVRAMPSGCSVMF